MKIKQLYNNIKNQLTKRKKLLLVLSLVCTLVISVYNRVVGAIRQSLWHESISIYYFSIVALRAIILTYMHKSKARQHDGLVFVITKTLLIVLNLLLVVPILLMITNKRPVQMDAIFSIAIALYTTIKTTTTIISFVKTRKQTDVLARELKVINLTDVVVSILTLQNTLIAVNSDGSDQSMYYLTIATSIVGFLVNMYFVITLKRRAVQVTQDNTMQLAENSTNVTDDVSNE